MADELDTTTEPNTGEAAASTETPGATLLTKGDEQAAGDKPETQGETKDEGSGDGEKPGEKPGEDENAKVPDSPEGYKLDFSPDTNVDKDLLGNFTKTAHELGITNEQARKLAGMYEGHVKDAQLKMQKAAQEHVISTVQGWEKEITSAPTFPEDRAYAMKALRQFGDKELNAVLDQTYLGSHPRFFKFMAQVGKALSEGGFKGIGSADHEDQDAAKVLYPNMA
ncbi:MAG: hypothetical protein LBO64_03380 [Desulfovibrio sp.]|jgi:hypothetical protein|nr:hypothetical protein [Desulfovibrio sp.]